MNSEKHREGNRRRNKRWRENNPEHVRALDRAKSLRHYYKHHEQMKDEMRERARVRHASTPPDKRRSYRLKLAYGITLQDRDVILASQGGVCAACGKNDPGSRGWQVDHCHDHNRVRGIICMQCNTGLGLANHDPTILRKWIKYLT